jgi:hypothetical protein
VLSEDAGVQLDRSSPIRLLLFRRSFPLCFRHSLPRFGADRSLLRRRHLGHPLRRPSSLLAASEGQAFKCEDCLVDVLQFGPEFHEHFRDVHASSSIACLKGGHETDASRPARITSAMMTHQRPVRGACGSSILSGCSVSQQAQLLPRYHLPKPQTIVGVRSVRNALAQSRSPTGYRRQLGSGHTHNRSKPSACL